MQYQPHPPQPTNYRADIDGLRAVAVLSVLVFHAFPAWLPGGFVGVDVFFVISGYLISGVLFQHPNRQVADLLDFYVRRIRRIYPALAVVMLSVLVLGWFTLLADEYDHVGKHMAGGAAFVANWVLWSESGYFDQASTLKPLLHLWSLGIEEQFYLIWPLALVVAMRFRWPLGTFTLMLLLASFGWNLWSHESRPVDAFYLPWARCWELLAGAWLAYAMGPQSWRPNPKCAQYMAPVGLLLVVLAWALLDEASAFPGWWALMPVWGAVLIIAAGQEAWLNRHVLSHRVLVGIGLISYPLYLWHWPLISWLHITEGQPPSSAWLGLALAASFALAYATWRWVEKPLRFATSTTTAWALFLCVAGLGVMGWTVYAKNGFPNRTAAQAQVVYSGDHGHQAFNEWLTQHTAPCTPNHFFASAETWEGHVRCRQSRPGPVDVALVGDSHAEHLFPGLVQQYPQLNIAYYFKIGPAVLGNPKFDAIFEHLARTPSIRHVVLTMFWERRLGGVRPNTRFGPLLSQTIEHLKSPGRTITLTTGVPHFNFDPDLCRLRRPHLSGEGARCEGLSTVHPLIEQALHNAKAQGAQVLDTRAFFCSSPQDCSMVQGDHILYRDDNHLNLYGSNALAQHWLQKLPDWGRNPTESP
jgi:peptidoglycan/LPS O-acetylase OafA/YrhL